VLDNTYIFFITDHGISHARGKQFMYEEGTRIPLVVRGPGLTAGEVRDDLCVHIDLAASSLSFAGIDIPKWMESVDLFDEDYQRRDYIISARDRCDETVDHMRSVRTENFKYIRNFLPKRPYLQPNAYKDNKSIVMRMRELYAAGKLDAAQAKILAESRPQEELYDLVADPNELTNLASQPKHQKQLIHLRATLDKWVEKSQDAGRAGESDSMYDSDMKVYLDTIKIRRPERAAEIQSNIDLMKKWQSLQQ
jgi:arylsulfatase A-like enzyme